MAIQHIVEKLKSEGHRGSTKKSYRSTWKNFNEFFIRLDVKPSTWEERIILFVGHLVQSKKQSSTIKSYVSAIKAVLAEDGVKLNQDIYLLKSLTRACHLKNDKVKTRLPIQQGVLNILLKQVTVLHADQPFLCTMYKALFSTAYFGLFRVSELTLGEHPVLARDVHIADNKQKFTFILRTSKTHGLGDDPQQVKISSKPIGENKHMPTSNLCPYQFLRDYICLRGPFILNIEPFFIFRDKSPVAPRHMRVTLKTCLKAAGFQQDLYDTHSLRAGRLVDMLKFGLSVKSIKKAGQWTSNSVFKYLKC